MKTHARERTVSARKRSGSRKNKKLLDVYPDYQQMDRDIDHEWAQNSGEIESGSYRMKPNHQARAVDIRTCFPLLDKLTGH